MPIQLDRPAENLDEVYQTLTPEPLRDENDFQRFYSDKIDEVRGGSKIDPMVRGLNRAFGGAAFKTFFVGHPGVGKSTEMYRLSHKIKDKFRVVRFAVPDDLNAAGFQPYEVLLVIMMKLAEEVKRLQEIGAIKEDLPADLMRDISLWFATAKYTSIEATGAGISAEAGIKPSPLVDTISGLLGLFAQVKGDIKYNTERKKEITEYRITTLSQLVGLLNRFLDHATRLLKEGEGKEWLIIGEDFDRPGVPTDRIETLFVQNANLFHELRANLIFNIPVALAYSGHQSLLPLDYVCIYDTPVYTAEHQNHDAGRAALTALLDLRLKPELFAPVQQERLVVASGGNLRDLFLMTAEAADYAALRKDNTGIIDERDVTRAINERRRDYLNRLGSSPYDDRLIPYEEKARRMVGIYKREPGYNVIDDVLHSLLRAIVVQEFNGEGYYALHPLIVDVLQRQGKLLDNNDKPLPGGSI
jgi:hypothetical protein